MAFADLGHVHHARATRVFVVRKQNAGTDKSAIGYFDSFPDHNPVFNGYTVADHSPAFDESVITNVAIFAQTGIAHHMGKSPDAGTGTNIVRLA